MINRIIGGVLFDFLGALTTDERPITLSSKHNAAEACQRLTEWADSRGICLDDAEVQNWRVIPDWFEIQGDEPSDQVYLGLFDDGTERAVIKRNDIWQEVSSGIAVNITFIREII